MRSEKLLVYLKAKFLGDAVMATPLLRVLGSHYSNLFVLAAPHVQSMLEQDSAGLTFIAPGPQRGSGAVWLEAARLRQLRFGSAVLVNRSFRSAMTVSLARIPRRVGHSTEKRGFLLTDRVPFDITKFEGEAYGDLARALGIEGDFGRVCLTVTAQEKGRGRDLLEGAEVGVQPGASFAAKTMPARALAAVVTKLQSQGRKVVLLGGNEERPFAEEVTGLVGQPVHDLVGKCDLRESMGVLANLKACVGASTGIMHIAAAVGCPTVTVFGPTDPIRWGHNYCPHESLKVPGGNIEDLDPDEVFKSVERVLG